MKISYRFAIAFIALFAVLTSCQLTEDMAINSRIDTFISQLNNSSRSAIYLNFDPDIPDYGAIRNESIFISSPLAYSNYPFSLPSRSGVSDIGGGLREVTGVLEYLGSIEENADFVLIQVGGDWLIHSFTLYTTPDPFIIDSMTGMHGGNRRHVTMQIH
jgi:hypothetical protein